MPPLRVRCCSGKRRASRPHGSTRAPTCTAPWKHFRRGGRYWSSVMRPKPAISVILAQAAAIGCPSVAISHNPPANDVPRLALPLLSGPLIASVFQIVTLQLLTLRCSELLGLTSGKFRYPQPQVKLAPRS